MEKSPPDPKPNPLPNLTLTLPLTHHGGFFPGTFPETLHALPISFLTKKENTNIVLSSECPTKEVKDYQINLLHRNIFKDCKRTKNDEERKL